MIGTEARAVMRAVVLLAFVACGDNLTPEPVANTPARPPQVSSAGGPVLSAPNVVPIFFAGDADMQAQLEAFLAALAGSSFWTATTAEYGVGSLTILPSIVVTDTPPTTAEDLDRFIEFHFGIPRDPPGQAAAAKGGDPSSIFVVFLPDGVTLTAGGESCKAFGGYHDESSRSGVVYALLPRCTPTGAPIDAITPALSHELIEAATDPHPFTAPAYVVVDDPQIVWAYTPGGELGDMCEYVHASRQRLVGNYLVQRTWSNASAMAGHDPCVPALAAPYIVAIPLLEEVDFVTSQRTIHTYGIELATGASATVDIALLSDGDAAPWTVAVDDVAMLIQQMPAELSVALDATTGRAGDKLRLRITRLKNGVGGGSELVFRSRIDDETQSMWWALVTNGPS